MATADPKIAPSDPSVPTPTPQPSPDLSSPDPSFGFPQNIPPAGPIIEAPPIQVLPNDPGSDPLGDPDEGGEERDFPVPPEPMTEPLIEGGDAEQGPIAAGANTIDEGTGGAPEGGSGSESSVGGSDEAGGGGDEGGAERGGEDAG